MYVNHSDRYIAYPVCVHHSDCYLASLVCVHQVKKYEEQCDLILVEVEKIERENLELMGGLFECNVEDLKVTR